MNFLPLCTASVWPTISGTTVERRDQVLITFLSPPTRFIPSTFSSRCKSTNGPFFTDLPIYLISRRCSLLVARGSRLAERERRATSCERRYFCRLWTMNLSVALRLRVL